MDEPPCFVPYINALTRAPKGVAGAVPAGACLDAARPTLPASHLPWKKQGLINGNDI